MSDETTSATDDRPRRTWSPARRAAAEKARGQQRATADHRPSDVELVAEQVIGEAIDNLKGAAALFVTPVAPYSGITITGVPADGYEPAPDDWKDPKPQLWVVQSRAEMIGRALLPQVQRNPRLLRIVHQFNQVFRQVELLEAAAAVVAAGAVDAKLVEPDATVKLPGGIEYPILEPAIGDTIEFIRRQREAWEAQNGVRMDPTGRGAQANGTHVGGEPPPEAAEWARARGVETPTAEAWADMQATQARLRRREEERESAGTRREGQTRVDGGVEGT